MCGLCRCAPLCVSRCAWRPEVDFECLSQSLSTLVLETESLVDLHGLAHEKLECLASELLNFLLLLLPRCWDYRLGLFRWVLGIQIQVLVLM